jgi:type III restriction enzyme
MNDPLDPARDRISSANHARRGHRRRRNTVSRVINGKRWFYERIRGSAPDPSLHATHLPNPIEFTRGKDVWPKHLYADPEGNIPLSFTSSWETETITEALKDPTVVAWLRNRPHDDWALCIPWIDKTVAHPFFPDFLVVRSGSGRLVVDILDPHDNSRPDAPKKAQGLAMYARTHGLGLGHIDLIAKVGNRMRVLHLDDEKTRKAVEGVTTNDALLALYAAV